MASEALKSTTCHLLKSKAEIQQLLASKRKEKSCLESQLHEINEQLSCMSQWIELLQNVPESKEFLFEADKVMGGLSVSKKLNLLEMEQQTFVEKHQKIEVLHELNKTKIENLELHFKLMTYEEKSLFEKLDSVTTCLKE